MGGLLRSKGSCRRKWGKGMDIGWVPALRHGVCMYFIILTPLYKWEVSNLQRVEQFLSHHKLRVVLIAALAILMAQQSGLPILHALFVGKVTELSIRRCACKLLPPSQTTLNKLLKAFNFSFFICYGGTKLALLTLWGFVRNLLVTFSMTLQVWKEDWDIFNSSKK